jgi:hypothetical protein
MQMTQLSGAGTPRGIAPHDEHRGRWKLRLFTWPFRHRPAAADSLTSGGSEPSELSATSLLQECELHDEALAAAHRRLETLEVDPDTDELTLVMARHEVFRRKHQIAETFTS